MADSYMPKPEKRGPYKKRIAQFCSAPYHEVEMRSWQTEGGRLTCRWFEVGQHVPYNPPWMQDTSQLQSGYIPPIPDFASHSPFGGASWLYEKDQRQLQQNSN